LLSSAADFWQKEITHSAEQQLALLGFVGVPVKDRPKSRLVVTEDARNSIEQKLGKSQVPNPKSQIALLHPVAAFATKQWPTENFARTAEFLSEEGFAPIAVAASKEGEVLKRLKQFSQVPIITFDNLSLPEITALAARAKIFVGNDSGIAHIAAAVRTPAVVIFGSSIIGGRGRTRPTKSFPKRCRASRAPVISVRNSARRNVSKELQSKAFVMRLKRF
jgi:ADP-heptose:LPS heptosyltransferase